MILCPLYHQCPSHTLVLGAKLQVGRRLQLEEGEYGEVPNYRYPAPNRVTFYESVQSEQCVFAVGIGSTYSMYYRQSPLDQSCPLVDGVNCATDGERML